MRTPSQWAISWQTATPASGRGEGATTTYTARIAKADEHPLIVPLSRLHLDKPSFPVLPLEPASAYPQPQSSASYPSYPHALSDPDISAATNQGGAGTSEWDLASTISTRTGATDPKSQSAGGARKTRARSPVKSPLDLRFAVKPLRYEAALPTASPASLSDVDKALIRDLKKISSGQGTIPPPMQKKIQDAAGELDEIALWMLADDASVHRDATLLHREFEDIKELLAHSVDCDEMEMSEAAWNTNVHMPLLRLALQGFPALKASNITSARPCRELLPKNLTGDETEAKLVDLSINLLADSEPDVEERIRALVAAEPAIQLRTINQSLYKPLCLRPSALCIETKGASGGTDGLEARSQILQWTSAWLTRMRRFLQARSVNTLEANAIMAKLGFPVIVVSCSSWHLYLVRDTATAVTMYNILDLGNTHSLLGIYKLLSSLRRLAGWAKGPYWAWFKDDILAMQMAIGANRDTHSI